MPRICIHFVVLLCLAGPAISAEAKRVALVIGNSTYKHAPTLANPHNDATAIAKKLRNIGFEVILGLNLDHAGMRAHARRFTIALKRADVAVFYYAGHGVQVHGRNLLVPTSAQLSNEADLDFQALPLALILRQMERETKTNLVFLDACRDNPFTKKLSGSMGTRSTAVGRGLARISSGLGTLIAFATQPGNVALDGQASASNSPFTAAILKYIEVPGLDINSFLIKVRQDVVSATKGRQVPWENSSLTGRFFFRRIAKETCCCGTKAPGR